MPPRLRPRLLSRPSSLRPTSSRSPITPVQRCRCYATEAEKKQPMPDEKDPMMSDRTGPIAPTEEELKRAMDAWLRGPGRVFKRPLPGSTNYLSAYDQTGNLQRLKDMNAEKKPTPGATPENEGLEAAASTTNVNQDGIPPERERDLRPFPLNQHFKSQPVLSEELREEIWRRVKEGGKTVKTVSIELGVSLERTAAVVRLKGVEKQWIAKGKTLAKPYSRAVLSMVPTTTWSNDPNFRPREHEPINDLPVHAATRAQLFWPTSESRHFTRTDAGKAFGTGNPDLLKKHEALLPAERRIPQPDLVAVEKDVVAGLSQAEVVKRQSERMKADVERLEKREQARKEKEKDTIVAKGRRWDFRFTPVKVEDVGKTGRDIKGTGWRYGFPHEDRKPGQVKIPRKVEA